MKKENKNFKAKRRTENLANACGQTSVWLLISGIAIYCVGGILEIGEDVRERKLARKASKQ